MAQLAHCLQTLHNDHSVVYRDLKAENVIVCLDGNLQLIDFGFAKLLNNGQRTLTNCGTVGYTAPEVLTGLGHSFEADVWSLGVLMAFMHNGKLPFEECDNP